MDLHERVLMFIILSLQTSVFGYTLTQYNFHENCGRTLDPFEVAGELIFDSQIIHDHKPRYRTRHCEVTISPKEVHNDRPNRILFYFTEFNIGRRCKHNNLTVIDGRHLNVHVQGIPDVLCGHNTSLEDNSTVFTSIKPDIRLLYEWSEYGETFSGTFKLVFVAFFDANATSSQAKGSTTTLFHTEFRMKQSGGRTFRCGRCNSYTCTRPCDSENSVFSCENNRCISTDVSCEDGINACGDGRDSKCDILDTLSGIVQTIVEFIKDIGIIIAVGIGIFILKKLVYDRLIRKYGSIRNVPIIESFFRRDTSLPYRPSSVTMQETSGQTRVSEDRVSLNSSEEDRFSIADYNNHQQQQQQQGDVDETAPTNSADLPTYDTFVNDSHRYPPTNPDNSYPPPDPSAPPPPPDVAPPPSYEDVMANNDRYVK